MGIQAQLRQISGVAEQYKVLSEEFEHKSTELELIRERLKQTVHHQLAEEVKQLEQDIHTVEEGVKTAKETVKEREKKLKDLEYKVKHAKELRDKELKTADELVKKCKKAADASKSKWSAKEHEEGSLTMELDELKKAIATAEEQLLAVAETVKKWEEDITNQGKEVEDAVKEVNRVKEDLKQQKD